MPEFSLSDFSELLKRIGNKPEEPQQSQTIEIDPMSTMGRFLSASGYKFKSTIEGPIPVNYDDIFGPDTMIGRLKRFQEKKKAKEDAFSAEYERQFQSAPASTMQATKQSYLGGAQGSDISNRYSGNQTLLTQNTEAAPKVNPQRQTLLGG